MFATLDDIIKRMLHVDAYINACGHPGRTKKGQLSLFVTTLKVLQASPFASLEYLLECVHKNELTIEKASEYMDCSIDDINELLNTNGGDDDDRKKLLRMHRRRLQGLEVIKPPKHRPPKLRHYDRQLLFDCDKYIRYCKQFPVVKCLDHNNSRVLPYDPCMMLESNMLSYESRISYLNEKKKPQIRWFLDQLKEDEGKTMSSISHIIDIGGGRGDLAINFALTYPHIHVIVVDINKGSLDTGENVSKQLRIDNIEFQCVDINAYEPPSSSSSLLFIGLHACGSLCDTILNYTMKYNDAKCLVCTCCFTKIINSNDDDDDNDDDDFQRICRLAESPDTNVSQQAMHIINAYRLLNISKQCVIKAMPLQYTPRNLVIHVK